MLVITFTRQLVDQLRRVCTRALGLSARSQDGPPLHVQGGCSGLSLIVRQKSVAIRHRLPGNSPDLDWTLPWEFLRRCGARQDEPLMLEPHENQLTARWQEAGIPQTARFEWAERSDDLPFPAPPAFWHPARSQLLSALAAASETADREASRYALGHLQLRGQTGEVVASDGRQLLIQGGFSFPWNDNLLIPACPVFGCRELQAAEEISLGFDADWLTLQCGPWTVQLQLEHEARFPDTPSIVPPAGSAVASVELSRHDAKFLARAIKLLPSTTDRTEGPLTVDLNGAIAVRARGVDDSHATELVLVDSKCSGDPLRFNTSRQYLTRALKLGFRELELHSPQAPVCCRDSHRTYVWALLDADSALPPDPRCQRIASRPETPAGR